MTQHNLRKIWCIYVIEISINLYASNYSDTHHFLFPQFNIFNYWTFKALFLTVCVSPYLLRPMELIFYFVHTE
jgi:hypothetical protein